MKRYKILFDYRINTHYDTELKGWLIPENELKQFEKEGISLDQICLVPTTPKDLCIDLRICYRIMASNSTIIKKAYDFMQNNNFDSKVEGFQVWDFEEGKYLINNSITNFKSKKVRG